MTMQSNQVQDAEYDKKMSSAKTFGGAVYVGGVVGATILFITFVLSAFPADAYFTRVVMTLAGVAVGCSMLAFPVALHNWTVTKDHRAWATFFYYGEMTFIGVNTIVSFVNLLAKYTDFKAPQWAVLYEPFSILSIIYVIAAWGTIFLKDPHSQRIARQREFNERYENKISDKTLEFLDTIQGEDAIIAAATEDIQSRIASRGRRGNFGSHRTTSNLAIDPQKGFVSKEQTAASVSVRPAPTPLPDRSMICMECGRPSGTDLYCSDTCEIEATRRNMEYSEGRLNQLQGKAANQPGAPFRSE